MSEPKYAYRIPPCSKYDIAGMESWLEDMAAKGLFLDRDGLFLGFATFVRNEPETLRFRLAATDTTGGLFSSTNDPEDDVIQLHRQMGWDYRGRWGQFHIYAADDPDAPELHTDPRVQALTIQALNKFQRSDLFGILLYTLMMYLFHGSMVFSLTALWSLGKTLLTLGFLLSFLVRKLANLVKMVRLKRQLKRGVPMSHRSDWRKRSWRRYAVLAAEWALGLYLAFSLLALTGESITQENRVPLEDWNEPFPFATVADIFPEGEITEQSYLLKSDLIHWSNWIATDNYDYTESCQVRLPDGTFVMGYIQVWYYDTRFDWFAQGLARELAQQFGGTFVDRLFTGRDVPTPLEGLDADYAVWYEYYGNGMILCRGGTVLRIHYNQQLGNIFTPEEFAQMILAHLA